MDSLTQYHQLQIREHLASEDSTLSAGLGSFMPVRDNVPKPERFPPCSYYIQPQQSSLVDTYKQKHMLLVFLASSTTINGAQLLEKACIEYPNRLCQHKAKVTQTVKEYFLQRSSIRRAFTLIGTYLDGESCNRLLNSFLYSLKGCIYKDQATF